MTALLTTSSKKHNLFSASAASRWLACPGSIRLSQKAPPQRDSSYAAEGTEAHAVLEAFMKNQGVPAGQHPPEMIEHAREAMQAIRDLTPSGAEVYSETKCKLDWIHSDMGGTTDAAIVEPYGKLIVIDFKYGGIPVDPKDNPQLISYALALAHEHDYEFTSVELVVIQPRALDVEENGAVKKWETDIETLKAWAVRFQSASRAAFAKNPGFEAGDHCKYCPAATICPTLRDKNLATIQAEFEPASGMVALPLPPIASAKAIPNLGRILDACDRLETWIGAVRNHAYHVLETGGHVEGYKLVEKRSTRKWVDEVSATISAKNRFGVKAFTTPELLSPAQLEKAVGKANAKEFVEKHSSAKSSGTTIAPESDKRPAFNLFEAEFKALPEGESKCEKNAKVVRTSSRSIPSSIPRSANPAKASKRPPLKGVSKPTTKPTKRRK